MNELLLPWTTRGRRYDTRAYLSSTSYTETAPTIDVDQRLRPDLSLAQALPIIRELAHEAILDGPPVEYGCFNIDGKLLEPGTRLQRQVKNSLYYMVRSYFNVSRGEPELGSGFALGHNEPIPNRPSQGEWAVMLSEGCKNRQDVLKALQPLINLRQGRVLETPAFHDCGIFQNWVDDAFHARQLPPYLLICDDFSNINLEIQFVLNALSVTGRLLFDTADEYAAYGAKVLDGERGAARIGNRCILASPKDDTVTYLDCHNLIMPIAETPAAREMRLEVLLGDDFDHDALLAAAAECRFLGLYSHGLGMNRDEFDRRPELQGAFVLIHDSKADEGLLTPDELARHPFVSGGIFFSPACLAGGMQGNSDYAAWIDPVNLTEYTGIELCLSDVARQLLGNPRGPVAFLAHFDISMASNAPMTNVMRPEENLQTTLHKQFVNHLNQGWSLGRATKPFRWAAGNYYARSIHSFSQLTGTLPLLPENRDRAVGDVVCSMCRDHVTATDFRNFIILGDPAVRLP